MTGETVRTVPRQRGPPMSCRVRNRARSIEKNIPASPPVRIASTSIPSGSTVTSPPPTSETSRD